MSTKQSPQELTPEKLRNFKIGMTVVLGVFSYLSYSGVVSVATEEAENPSFVVVMFITLSILTSGIATVFSMRARKGPLAPALIATAQFEAVTLFAFVYSVIAVGVPKWLIPAVAVYSLIGIWAVVPNRSEQQDQ